MDSFFFFFFFFGGGWSNVTQLRYRDKDIVYCEGYKPRLTFKKMKMMQKVFPACLVTPCLSFNFESPSTPAGVYLHTNLTNLNLLPKIQNKKLKTLVYPIWYQASSTKGKHLPKLQWSHQPSRSSWIKSKYYVSATKYLIKPLSQVHQQKKSFLFHGCYKNLSIRHRVASKATSQTGLAWKGKLQWHQ